MASLVLGLQLCFLGVLPHSIWTSFTVFSSQRGVPQIAGPSQRILGTSPPQFVESSKGNQETLDCENRPCSAIFGRKISGQVMKCSKKSMVNTCSEAFKNPLRCMPLKHVNYINYIDLHHHTTDILSQQCLPFSSRFPQCSEGAVFFKVFQTKTLKMQKHFPQTSNFHIQVISALGFALGIWSPLRGAEEKKLLGRGLGSQNLTVSIFSGFDGGFTDFRSLY